MGVVAALAAEARALRSASGAGEAPWLVAVSGMGGAAAAAAARSLVASQVSALMTFGLAGGLDPALNAGDIVLPRLILSAQGVRFIADESWRERVSRRLGTSRALSEGALLSSVEALQTPATKSAAFASSRAVAVDMESSAVAEVAAANHLPFIALRVIVDTAADTLPSSVMAASRHGQVQIGRVLTALLSRPYEIGAVLRLSRRYGAAMRALRTVSTALA